MKTFRLEIKRPKKATKHFTVLGWTLLLVGITLSFILGEDFLTRALLIGIPLLIGLLILISLQIIYPIEKTGFLELDSSEIKINNRNGTLTLNMNQVVEIKVVIGGGHMTLNKNWPLTREIFPVEHGHNNEIEFTKSNGDTISTELYLTGDVQERNFKSYLTHLADQQKIKLQIKNN